MVPLLGPVDAIAHERSFAGWYLDADLGEKIAAVVGELVADVVAWTAQPVVAVAAGIVASIAADKNLALEQAGHHLHAQPAGQMVVAGACCAQSRRTGAFAK